MKVGMCGAGGTGKSTIAEELALRLTIPLIKSPSRACFEKRGVKTEDDQLSMSSTGRYLLQMDIFEAITKQVKEHKVGLFERTQLDNFFYMLHRCHDIATRKEIEEARELTIQGLQTFDAILFFPLYDWPDPTDGMRTIKYGGRLLAHHFMGNFLLRHVPEVRRIVPLLNQPPTERINWVIDRLTVRGIL
jgi:hypothetical protein